MRLEERRQRFQRDRVVGWRAQAGSPGQAQGQAALGGIWGGIAQDGGAPGGRSGADEGVGLNQPWSPGTGAGGGCPTRLGLGPGAGAGAGGACRASGLRMALAAELRGNRPREAESSPALAPLSPLALTCAPSLLSGTSSWGGPCCLPPCVLPPLGPRCHHRRPE